MFNKKIIFLTALLIFICCIGAASAAEDINNDTLTTDSDVAVVEQADDSDDTALEVSNDEDVLSATGTATVSTWANLKTYAQKSDKDYTITVTNGNYNVGSDSITFGNNAKIIGSGNTVITGGSSSVIPFQATGKSITFCNLIFRNMSSDMVIKLVDSGSSKIENCVFENILTGTSGQKSVVYNNGGYMQVINTNFTNCNTTYGVITNHKNPTSTLMDVENCKFEYNNANSEPGAINNCGIMNITACVFNYNHAGLWAGAVHTHANAKSVIKRSSFTGNTAGWNGGALYTYATLEVYDSNFTNNNCSSNNGGGAIGASNYFFASNPYNVTINNCRFTDNNNLCHLLDNISTYTLGRGGAISVTNGGVLSVTDSTFIHNSARLGQAICAYNTNSYANISEGEARLVIKNNQFINHTFDDGTTVLLDGTYTFTGNTFINSPQVEYDDDNTYNSAQYSLSESEPVLGVSFDEVLNDVEYIDGDKLKETVNNLKSNNQNGLIYLKEGTWSSNIATNTQDKINVTIIGQNRKTTILNPTGNGYRHALTTKTPTNFITWINVTFKTKITLSMTNFKFINCTFENTTIDLDAQREKYQGMAQGDYKIANFTFENCEFVNYSTDLILNCHKTANVILYNCTFENVTGEAIGETNAELFKFCVDGDNGIYVDQIPGLTIKESTFKNINVKGIIKAKNGSIEFVSTNNKYDFATQKTLVSDEYTYIDVLVNATNLTVKVADIKEGENLTIDVTLSNNLTTNVTVVINQKEYTVSVVNGTGSLDVSDKLAANTYNVDASYDGEYPYAASNNTTTFKVEKVIINTALTAPKVSATYNVAKNLVITLKDANGNVLVGKYVTVKVGTISKNIQTDKKGQVSVNVATLVPKSYTASISFTGDDDYNKASTTAKVVVSKATPKLTTKKLKTKVKVKTKKVTATLKDNKGKVLKNTKVTLKVKGKTYTAKTNKKGKATFKVTKLNKKGTFKGKVKFAGNKYFKAVSKTVKIVVKK